MILNHNEKLEEHLIELTPAIRSPNPNLNL